MTLEIKDFMITVKTPEGHPDGEPIPLSVRVDRENPNVWASPHNGVVYAKKEIAESAYRMSTDEYRKRSRERIDASRIVRAEHIDAANYDGWVTVDGCGDDYFSSVEDLIDYFYEIDAQPPCYCWGTKTTPFDFDLADAIDSYLSDDHFEDAYDLLFDKEELFEFFDAWQKKQHIETYLIDYKRLVVLDKDHFVKHLAHCVKVMEGEME